MHDRGRSSLKVHLPGFHFSHFWPCALWLAALGGLAVGAPESRVLTLTRSGKLGYSELATGEFKPFAIEGRVAHFAVAPTADRLMYVVSVNGPDTQQATYYTNHFRIFVSELDGSEAKLLSDQAGDPNVYFTPGIGSPQKEMFPQCGGPLHPNWSGDGQRILFMGWREKTGDQAGGFPIYVASAADGKVERVLRVPPPTRIRGAPDKPMEELMEASPIARQWIQPFPFFAGGGYPDQFNWQMPRVSGPRVGGQLFSTDPVTGLPVADPASVTKSAGGTNDVTSMIWYGCDLRWHPEGDCVTWSCNTRTNLQGVWVAPLADLRTGSKATNRVSQLPFAEEFLWSPNGKQVALTRRHGGDNRGVGHQVLLADRASGAVVRVLYTDPPHPAGKVSWVRPACWSADNSKLAIYLHSVEKTNRFLILDVAAPNVAPVEIPDANVIELQLPLVTPRLCSFGADNASFHFLGFPDRTSKARTRELVSVVLPTKNANATSPPAVTRAVLVPEGEAVMQFGFVTPKAQACPPLEMVLPAGGNDWVYRQTEGDPKTRDRLLTGLVRLPDLKAQYQRANEEFDRLRKTWKTGEDSKADREAARQLSKLRQMETDYLRAVSPVFDAFTDAEERALVRSLRETAECLATRTAEALDAVQAQNSITSWDGFYRQKQIYDVRYSQLTHTLNGFQTINAMRLLKAQRRLSEARAPFARADRLAGNEATTALRPLQRRLRDVYLDMSWVSLQLNEAQAESALLEQDSYLAGVHASIKQGETIEQGNTLGEQAAQRLIFSMKALLAGGTSAMGGVVDSIKRVINWAPEALKFEAFFDTVSSEVTTKIKESREKSGLAVRTLERIRGYSDEQTTALMTRIAGDVGLTYLEQNRLFHEQTTGGLRRLAACYETDVDRLMDEELKMAQEHAALAVADMEKAFNARVGADAKGKFSGMKRVLTDPLGTVRTALQNSEWGGDHYSAPILHIANRKAQLQEMETVRQAMGRARFEPDIMQRQLPRNYAIHLELERDNPDYLQWTLVRERLAAQRRMDLLDRDWERAETPSQQSEIERKKVCNRALLTMEIAHKQSRLMQLQGADKLMVWDYDGALECFYQAAEAIAADHDRKGEADRMRANVEELRLALNWQKTVEAGMETAQQIGNLGVQAAMFEAAGQTIGWALPPAPAPAAAAAATTAAEMPWWLRPVPASGFADFVWKQVNPFSEWMSAAIVKQEWKAIKEASLGLGLNVGLQVVQQDMLKKGVLKGYFGLDEQWADLLANAVVNVPQTKLGSGNTLFYDLGRRLVAINSEYHFQIDYGLWQSRQEARRSVGDFHYFFEICRQFREAREKLDPKKLAGAGEAEVRTATAGAAEAHAAVRQASDPVNKETMEARYNELFPENSAKPGTPERLELIRKFFTGLNWKQHLMALKLGKGESLNRKIDNLRRELIAQAQVAFFAGDDHRHYAEYVVDYLYIGSAGKKDSKAYKLVGSDIDFTLLVREDTPESVRNQLREDFMVFFQKFAGGKELEGFEMSIMVDPMPRFFANGETAEGLVDMIWVETNPEKNAANRAALKTGIEKTIEQLIRNASDKERYLDRGNLFRHNLFVRLGCFLKKVATTVSEDGVELVNESPEVYDRLYGDIPLESGMAFDCVAGNLGYVFQHAAEHPNDAGHYQKQVGGKYAIRGPLYAAILMSNRARTELGKIKRADVEAHGWEGAERVVVEVARKILSEPGGQAELGLPTTISVPGRRELITMNAKSWMRLFDEWNGRKEGLPDHEIFAARRSPEEGALKPEDPALNEYLRQNIAESEACFKAMARKSIMDRSADLLKYRSAHKAALAANDTGAAEIFELKMKEVVCAQAAVWNRLSQEQQNLLLRELPPQADWMLGIAAAEKLKGTAARPAPTPADPNRVVLEAGALQALQPRTLLAEPAEDAARRVAQLKDRAKAGPAGKLFSASAAYDPKETDGGAAAGVGK